MTSIEFNKKYEDYLEDGFYGLDIDVPNVVDFLDDIFEDLTKISGFTFAQIKLKFGTARFYSNIGTGLSFIIEKKIDDMIAGVL